MGIFVNGFSVRADELKYDIKADFRDLNENGQLRLLTENKSLFLNDALTSQYSKIKELALQFKEDENS